MSLLNSEPLNTSGVIIIMVQMKKHHAGLAATGALLSLLYAGQANASPVQSAKPVAQERRLEYTDDVVYDPNVVSGKITRKNHTPGHRVYKGIVEKGPTGKYVPRSGWFYDDPDFIIEVTGRDTLTGEVATMRYFVPRCLYRTLKIGSNFTYTGQNARTQDIDVPVSPPSGKK